MFGKIQAFLPNIGKMRLPRGGLAGQGAGNVPGPLGEDRPVKSPCNRQGRSSSSPAMSARRWSPTTARTRPSTSPTGGWRSGAKSRRPSLRRSESRPAPSSAWLSPVHDAIPLCGRPGGFLFTPSRFHLRFRALRDYGKTLRFRPEIPDILQILPVNSLRRLRGKFFVFFVACGFQCPRSGFQWHSMSGTLRETFFQWTANRKPPCRTSARRRAARPGKIRNPANGLCPCPCRGCGGGSAGRAGSPPARSSPP